MARRKVAKPETPPLLSAATEEPPPKEQRQKKPWTFLFYLCGDNTLEPSIRENLADLHRAGSSAGLHVVVQCDRRAGACRYILPTGPGEGELVPDPSLDTVQVNTGEPIEALRFLLWGVDQAPSDHVAVIFSGLGINPGYVRQSLPPTTDVLGQEEVDLRIQRHLFSFCHDQTSRDALEAHELREVLEKLNEQLGRPIDVIGLDMGGAAFVEIAYQLEGMAEVFIASQGAVPDAGWPYRRILTEWQKRLAQREADARALGRLIVDAVADAYPGQNGRTVAVNLGALEDTARVLDMLALTLLQSLGDWHVLQSVKETLAGSDWVAGEGGEILPAVDMLAMLERLRDVLTARIPRTPEEFGQRERISHLETLVKRTLEAFTADQRSVERLLLHSRPSPNRGLSILMPPPREAKNESAASGSRPGDTAAAENPTQLQGFNLAESDYFNLQFSQRVHWAAVVGALQLILEKPHTLWRLVSSMLADGGGPAREALLRRLIGPDSVIVGLEKPFLMLSSGTVLTLSLESRSSSSGSDEGQAYLLRLESAAGGATVAQQESLVYQPTVEATLRSLEELLKSDRINPQVLGDLRALGRTLGEDLIQDLVERLEGEHAQVMGKTADGTVHLCLQIPRELMRYPWELLHDRQGMLSERFALGRQVFMEARLTRRLMRRKPGPIEALVIGDPRFTPEFLTYCQRVHKSYPRQLPGAQSEARMVINAFADLQDRGLAEMLRVNVTGLVGETVTVNEVRRFLRSGRFDLIHYAGHAFFDRKDPEGSAWLLSDGLLRAREIRNTLAWTESPPWLVFANACEAGMDAEASTSRYQGEVFGLASAFINQAVAAYIAPLWPVNDGVAAQLAVDFYRALLLERVSLGEALRRAKVAAREDWAPKSEEEEVSVSPSIALSWASVVLYGDPTPRLLDSLWTPHATSEGKDRGPRTSGAAASLPGPRRHQGRPRPRRLAQATAEEIQLLAAGPGMVPVHPGAVRGAAFPLGAPAVELVEIGGGIRVWRIIDPQSGPRFLPGSSLAETINKAPGTEGKRTVREILGDQRGGFDFVRVIGRWVIDQVSGSDERSLLLRLAEQYDKDTVAREQLFLIGPGPRLKPLPQSSWPWLDAPLGTGQADRVLLIIHGTLNKTEAPINGLGEKFLDWARRTYRGVIGFDHWTLSKTPGENAELLWELLDPRLRAGHRLDVITHSRGGLVARALVELLGHGEAVRRVVFLATPNAGTNLANPDNWGRAADMLVNLAHLDPTGLYGKLSGFLVHLLVRHLDEQIPGLQAQNPAAKAEEFLAQLQKPTSLPAAVTYAAVAANYEPERDDFNLKSVLSEVGDAAADAFYGGPNDLVVDTARVWAVDMEKPSLETVGRIIPVERLLLFNPDPRVPSPPGATLQALNGVHHTNVFIWEPTRDFLRQQLSKL